jgi:hypothetical protein
MRDPQGRLGVALEVLSPPRVLPVLPRYTTERRGPAFGMHSRSVLQAGEDPSVRGLTRHPWPTSTARAFDCHCSGPDFLVVLEIGISHRDSSHILQDTNVRSLGRCRHDRRHVRDPIPENVLASVQRNAPANAPSVQIASPSGND